MEQDAQLATELMGLPGRDEYIAAASELLLGLFPSEHAAWNDVDGRAKRSDAEHPVVVSFQCDPSDVLRRLSDLVSDRQLYRTRAFREGLSLLDVNRQLVFRTSGPNRDVFRGWSMNRWGQDFTDEEVELARHLMPTLLLLEQAYADAGQPSLRVRPDEYELTARDWRSSVSSGRA